MNYRLIDILFLSADCIDQLNKQLNGHLIKAVIDGAAGHLYGQYPAVMKQGGIIANYGQTSGEHVTFTMFQVAHNIELRGSTMGSRREFGEMIKFAEQYKVKPVVSDVFKGLSVESVQAAVDKME
jgi:D-arabinose 1-dehydrogenase-like Zn-dependent alcohol dehydrogenase